MGFWFFDSLKLWFFDSFNTFWILNLWIFDSLLYCDLNLRFESQDLTLESLNLPKSGDFRRLEDSKIQRFKDSRIQRFKDAKIQITKSRSSCSMDAGHDSVKNRPQLPYGSVQGACRQPAGSLRGALEFVWNCMELYGNAWNCMELYGIAWNSMELLQYGCRPRLIR